MPVTLKDVAKRAMVTPPVVSRVLHNKSSSVRVSAATAERVRKAAEELGYRVNVFARNFRAQQTRTIGVLNGMGLDRPLFNGGPRYFASLMDGIVDGAFRHEYSVTLCPQLLGGHPEEGISDGRFDGLIWYSIQPTDEVKGILDRCSAPLVVVHAHAADFDNKYQTVICDNRQGLGLAIDHLVAGGHRKIAFAIEGDAMNVESAERMDGFRLHMARQKLPIGDRDILDIRRDRAGLHEYLSGPIPHTAVIVHADGLASEFTKVAPGHGVRVPEDLSIIGFDSTEFCEQMQPTLTSISQPLFEIGRRSAEKLLDSIGGANSDSRELVIPCGLDIRGSSAPLSAK